MRDVGAVECAADAQEGLRKVHHSEGHRPGHSHPEVGSLHPVVLSGAADDDALRAYPR